MYGNNDQGYNQFQSQNNVQPNQNLNPYGQQQPLPPQNNLNPYQTTTYIPPNQYMNNGPVVAQSSAFPVNNQPLPGEMKAIQDSLKSAPVFITCPHCKHSGITRTDQSCSCLSVCCCLCFALIPFILFQVCRGKEINCLDAKHSCIKCGTYIGEYTSC